ncbi:MAG TPA: M12 family metallo-peptidase, partial [Thermoanaerobaculia bacterium]|nr:M12 family metallo-peptidase [Thermoanaerobaculia bacterium]
MSTHVRQRAWIFAALLIAVVSTRSSFAAATLPQLRAADLALKGRDVAHGQRLRVTGIELPATDETLALDVERFEVFAPDAEIVVHGAKGVTKLKAPANAYFRGGVEGEPGSRVFLEVLAGGQTRGMIVRPGDDTYLLDSADGLSQSAAPGRLAALRADAALLKAGRDPWKCDEAGLPPTPRAQLPWDLLAGPDQAAALAQSVAAAEPAAAADAEAPQALPAYTARVAIETDYEYYTRFNSVTNATNYVGNLIGFASTIYVNEINTSLVVQSVNLWTTSADPWSQLNTLCGLMEFGRYWNLNRTNVSRTIAHFLSGKNLGGGIAWLGVLCSGSFGAGANCPGLPTDAPWGGGYGFSASISGTFNINSPTMMWDIMAVAHEIGHNFNSPHSHCYANVGGSASPIDQCYGSESGCYAGAGALPGPAGTGSGTIMSYCHLVRSS